MANSIANYLCIYMCVCLYVRGSDLLYCYIMRYLIMSYDLSELMLFLLLQSINRIAIVTLKHMKICSMLNIQ